MSNTELELWWQISAEIELEKEKELELTYQVEEQLIKQGLIK